MLPLLTAETISINKARGAEGRESQPISKSWLQKQFVTSCNSLRNCLAKIQQIVFKLTVQFETEGNGQNEIVRPMDRSELGKALK